MKAWFYTLIKKLVGLHKKEKNVRWPRRMQSPGESFEHTLMCVALTLENATDRKTDMRRGTRLIYCTFSCGRVIVLSLW